MDNKSFNIEEINRNLQESYIHYDPNRVDYTINNLELNLIEQAGNSIWKDIFLATIGLGIPSLLNGYSDYCKLTEKSMLNSEIFINLLVAGICLGISIICFIVWQSNKKKFKDIISQIKNKPKYKLPSTSI